MARNFEKVLPVERWQQILGNISAGDLCSVMLTSRHMNSVASWPELWAGMKINMGKVREDGLAQLYSIHRFSKIKQMSFEGMHPPPTTVEWERLLKDVSGSPLENLNFTRCPLYVDIEVLASIIHHLKTLNLSGASFPKVEVLEASLSSKTLVDLDLSLISLTDLPPDLLAKVVQRLIRVNLCCTQLTTDQCIKVLEASLSSTTLTHLDLSWINLSEVPSDLLASAVKRLKVNLSGADLTTDQCIKTLEASLSCTTLVDLDLYDIDLSGVPPDLLASAVKRLNSVRFYRYLTTNQCIKILEASLSSTTLVDLNLTSVNLSGVPPDLLASAVKRLYKVKLEFTDMTTAQCIKVLEASLCSTTLNDLDLNHVDLSEVPPDLLAKAVKRLKTVNLSFTMLIADQGVAVLKSIPSSITLRRVDLSFNQLRENLPYDPHDLLTSLPAYVTVDIMSM